MRQIPFVQTMDLLQRHQIALVRSGVFTEREKAWAFIEDLPGPAVMKIDAAEIWHRTEAEGVFLDIDSRERFEQAWNKLTDNRNVRGVIVQEMCSGIELSLGVKRDHQFGPVVMFGLGGILVELLEDVSFRIAPFEMDEAFSMISEIKSYRLLTGYRGRPPVDQNVLAQMLISLGSLAAENPEIEEVDLNPVMAERNIVQAVDAKIWILGHES